MMSIEPGSIASKKGREDIPECAGCMPQSNKIFFPLNERRMEERPTSFPAPSGIMVMVLVDMVGHGGEEIIGIEVINYY